MGKTVLIVEDEQNIVDILSFNLSREGYDTLEAYDGPTGLQLALEQNPDLILLDLMLPGMNGFDVCAKIRESGSSIPIIMLTAREEEEDKVMGLEQPRVALVNNGAEDTKGTPMYREAHGLLKANPAIRFVGNIEPRDIMAGEVDVIVCDGFVGNVVLKLTEGVAGTLLGMLKDIFMQSIVTKLCYLGVKGGLRNLKHMMDSEEIGGAPLLGAAKPVIKAHGSSKAKGIKNAIRQARLCVANDLCGTMQSALAEVAAKAAAEKTDAE